jgi:PBP1b-binding outer membrane lipoprotein LpoB
MKFIFSIIIVTLLITGCSSSKKTTILPQPATVTSDIREIHLINWEESGERDLHLQGKLFSKRMVNDTIQVVPCDSCLIKIMMTSGTGFVDTTLMTKNGVFNFQGPMGVYTFSMNNPGMNPLDVTNVDFSEGGINSIIIANAVGNKKEKILVSRKEHRYSWELVK